ncbi:MAG: hypothetical protein GXP37_15650 [Chloroflexi bacterium]|nr:hypothetical protein [Chloroflexota bacterium]
MNHSEYDYTAYGLIWRMPLACPELMPAPAGGQRPDVVIRYGAVPESLPGAAAAGPLRQVTPEAVLFQFPDVARYLARGGCEIVIQREPEAGDDEVRLFLFGTVVTLLLHQRGILPIHASAILTERGAVLFVGHSGFGKSTLLAAFMNRGYSMLADDAVGIVFDETDVPLVFPGYQQIKLWADSAERVERTTDGLHRVRPQHEKFAVPAADRLAARSAPLHVIYALRPYNGSELRLEPLQDARKFNVLLDYTFQKLVLKRMGRHIDHFRMAVAVANGVRVARVSRPEQPFLLEELADLLERDFS